MTGETMLAALRSLATEHMLSDATAVPRLIEAVGEPAAHASAIVHELAHGMLLEGRILSTGAITLAFDPTKGFPVSNAEANAHELAAIRIEHEVLHILGRSKHEIPSPEVALRVGIFRRTPDAHVFEGDVVAALEPAERAVALIVYRIVRERAARLETTPAPAVASAADVQAVLDEAREQMPEGGPADITNRLLASLVAELRLRAARGV